MANNNDVPLPNLVVKREEARRKIESQIEHGNLLVAIYFNDEEELEKAKLESYKWDNYNRELLQRIFDNLSIANEYSFVGYTALDGPESFLDDIYDFRDNIKTKIHRLESILERLELIPESITISNTTTRLKDEILISRKVFIVHGQDEEMKQSVARVLDRLELDPIILHEKPDKGKTIIDKFTKYSDVGYAVVLLSPDDLAYLRSDSPNKAKLRARQNVIFELGYFLGKLGRDKVLAIYRKEENFEMPSDYSGVLFTEYDKNGMWKFKLVQELNAVGINVDANKLM